MKMKDIVFDTNDQDDDNINDEDNEDDEDDGTYPISTTRTES